MEELNIDRAKKEQEIKVSRDSLNVIISTIVERETKFNDSKKYLLDCKKSMFFSI